MCEAGAVAVENAPHSNHTLTVLHKNESKTRTDESDDDGDDDIKGRHDDA